VDFSLRKEIRLYGQTLVSVPAPTVQVVDSNGNASSDFTVSGVGLDPTATQVVFTLTPVQATVQVPGVYMLIITATLSGGETLVEGLTVEVEKPPGGMTVKCS
jgi:hypothetical protein